MNEGPTILSASDLMLTFLSNMSGQDVRYISGSNPFAIKIDGEDAFIYIKNLSPAQLSNGNPDVWRIQLPTKDEFNSIKESSTLFILLGYDAENMVYTTWNPYWCKQRLNVGKSVSMYSRLSLQTRVSDSDHIEKMALNNDGDVVCIPAKQIYYYIKRIKDYYPEDTVFVAKGSSIQKRQQAESSSLYYFFVEHTLDTEFATFLRDGGMSDKSTKDYTRYARFLKENGYLNKYKEVFLQYTSFADYKKAFPEFLHKDEIAVIDKKWNGYIRATLNHYLRYIMSIDAITPAIKPVNEQSSTSTEATNKYVSGYQVDGFGKLTLLNDVVINTLYPYYKEEDYPDFEQMIQIAAEYYPTDLMDKMTPVDWIKLFRGTKWKRTKTKSERVAKSQDVAPRTRKPNLSLRVTETNGTVIQKETPLDTFVYMIENSCPELLVEINFGRPVISAEKFPDFPGSKRSQQQIKGGFYLSTNFNTVYKAKVLQTISDTFNLGWTIEVIE